MLKKEFPNEGKSQQFLLISEVNSYLNAVNFQAIWEAYSPFEVLLELKFSIFITTNIIKLMSWKAIKPISSNKVQSSDGITSSDFLIT